MYINERWCLNSTGCNVIQIMRHEMRGPYFNIRNTACRWSLVCISHAKRNVVAKRWIKEFTAQKLREVIHSREFDLCVSPTSMVVVWKLQGKKLDFCKDIDVFHPSVILVSLRYGVMQGDLPIINFVFRVSMSISSSSCFFFDDVRVIRIVAIYYLSWDLLSYECRFTCYELRDMYSNQIN